MKKTASVTKVQQEAPAVWRRVLGGALLALGVITFFLAQSTVWVSTTFFNEDAFVATTKQVLATEESRTAIASTIVDSTLQNNPVAQQLAGSQLTALVSGLLGSDIAGQVYDRVAHRAYAYVTSPNREDIAIDLTSIKSPLETLVGLIERTGRDIQFDPETIPDSITLIESDALPDVSGYIQTMLFANALLWFATAAAFASYIVLYRHKLVRSIYIVGWSIIAVSAVALFMGPFIPPAVASLVDLIGIRGLVEDLAVAFIDPFQVQLLLGMVIAATVMLLVSLRGVFRTGAQKLAAQFK